VAADVLADRRRDRAVQALTGERVLITGASSGIGLAAARCFAERGARLVLLARGRDELELAARQVGVDAALVTADVTDRRAVEAAVGEAVAELGGLDVVVANAAAGAFGHFLDVDPDDFDRAFDITFRGTVNVVRATLPHLRASRGTLVATGSVVSRMPMPSWSSYAAGKHALRGFLNSVRIEEQEQRSGVQIAMVHPGVVDTPFWGRAASATGRRPRVPPAYDASVVGRALVEAAERPRRERVLGGVTTAIDRGFELARPLAEHVLVVADRWFRTGDEPAPEQSALWAPTGQPRTGDGIPSSRGIPAMALQAVRLWRSLSHPLPEVGGAARSTPQSDSPRAPHREDPPGGS
jgi:NAD(P)-dependent dehydrogenase (short-subunit alcohol dehydrogenase family)